NAFEFSTTNIVNMAAVTIKLIRLTSTIWSAYPTYLAIDFQRDRKLPEFKNTKQMVIFTIKTCDLTTMKASNITHSVKMVKSYYLKKFNLWTEVNKNRSNVRFR
ncbi:TPA: hypothetical protein ACPJ03_002346, partial [Vibrio diabolicus]